MKRIDTTYIILIHLYEWLEIHAFVCLYTFSDLYTLGMIHISNIGTFRRNRIILT